MKILSTAHAYFLWARNYLRGLRNYSYQLLVHSWRSRLIRKSLRHLYGDLTPALASEDPVVVCLYRNGESYLDSFIEHHLRLGFRHIFLLDNGSTDLSLEVAKRHSHVTVVESRLPYSHYQKAFKEFLLGRFGRGRWVLLADVDELFDFPHSESISLSRFLEYLSGASYTGVAAQMLDMFSNEPLDRITWREGKDLKKSFPYFDISAIKPESFSRDVFSTISNAAIQDHFGGIRYKVFGTNCFLTKSSLVFARATNVLDGLHKLFAVKYADISTVLYHYKFIPQFSEITNEVIARKSHFNSSQQYVRIQETMKTNKACSLFSDSSLELKDTADLVERGFLKTSKRYQDFVEGKT